MNDIFKGFESMNSNEFTLQKYPNFRFIRYYDDEDCQVFSPYIDVTEFEDELANYNSSAPNPYTQLVFQFHLISNEVLSKRLDIDIKDFDDARRQREFGDLVRKAFDYQKRPNNYARYRGVRLIIDEKNFDEWVYCEYKNGKVSNIYDRNGYQLIFD